MHGVARDALIIQELNGRHDRSDSPFNRFIERYWDFINPLACVILILIAWVQGEATAAGMYLALAAAVLSGYPIVRNSIISTITNRRLNAEVLVTCALIASIWVGEYLAAAMVVLMMNIGELLEDITIARTGEAVRALMELGSDTARVIRDGHEMNINIEEVRIGDLVLVKHGRGQRRSQGVSRELLSQDHVRPPRARARDAALSASRDRCLVRGHHLADPGPQRQQRRHRSPVRVVRARAWPRGAASLQRLPPRLPHDRRRVHAADTVRRAREQALRHGIRHVYTGNVHDAPGQSTYCAGCNALLIARDWYAIGTYRVTPEGRCPDCGHAPAGRLDARQGTWGPRRLPVVIA